MGSKAKRGQAAQQGDESAAQATGQQEQPAVSQPSQNGNGGPRQRPVYEHRVGRLKLIAWENQGKDGPWLSYSLSRSYRDAQGNWKNASTLGAQDLLVAAMMFQVAFLRQAEQHGNGNGNGSTQSNGHQNGNGQATHAEGNGDIPF